MSRAHFIHPDSLPHVWESIAAHASVSAVLALRLTSRAIREIVERTLYTHLVGRSSYQCPSDCTLDRTDPHHLSRELGTFRRGYLLAPREGGAIRIRVPSPQSPRAPLFRRCVRLELDDCLFPDEAAWLARLIRPEILRIRPVGGRHVRAGAIVGVIDASVVAISLAGPHYTHCYDATVPPDTPRVVVHQYATCAQPSCLLLQSMELPELVLVFLPKEGPTSIRTYLSRLLPRLPNTAVAIVGLDEVYAGSSAEEVRARFVGIAGWERVELRTRSEHRAVIGENRWADEMEL